MGAALVAAFMLVGASIAWACIPWAGKLEITAQNQNHDTAGETDGDAVYGADHTDVDSSGNTGGDRGNGQGMVWCSTLDTTDNGGDASQPYAWSKVRPDGTTAWDVELTVTGSDHECDSNVRLPEDKYSITYAEDSFDNHDDSTNGNNDQTFADDRESTENGGSDEVVDATHCMDIDDDETDGVDDVQQEWDLIEDDDGDGDPTDTRTDDSGGQTWFPADNNDVINQGPHSIEVDLDQFNPDPDESGDDPNVDANDSDDDGHFEAAGLCITSYDEYYHDNDNLDDDDSEVVGDECPAAPECTSDKDGVRIEYGNALPVNILPTS